MEFGCPFGSEFGNSSCSGSVQKPDKLPAFTRIALRRAIARMMVALLVSGLSAALFR